MTFTKADGSGTFIQPFPIDAAENTVNHPVFVKILGVWRDMCQSEEQLFRLGQAISQASLMSPRLMSSLFPGAPYNEHGEFQMNAQQQNDGSIVVDIRSDPNAPLLLHEQFVIQPDGSHECTVFDMQRPAHG